MSKLIGIDYGSKRVGVAVSDDSGSVAFPKMTLPNNARLVDDITALITEEGITTAVIGESKNASGADNAIMESARLFADQLRVASGADVQFEPEFYTSFVARRDTGAREVDAEAAAIILNSYIAKTKNA